MDSFRGFKPVTTVIVGEGDYYLDRDAVFRLINFLVQNLSI